MKGGEAIPYKRSPRSPRNPRNQPKPTKPNKPNTHKGAPIMATTADTTNSNTLPARKINFGNMGKAMPGNVYEGILDSFSYQESKPKPDGSGGGKPMYKLAFTIADEGEYKGRKLSRFFVIEGNALFYFFDALVKLGADAEELAPVDEQGEPMDVDIEPIMRTLLGAHCWLRVGEGEYNGRPSNSIDEIMSYNQ